MIFIYRNNGIKMYIQQHIGSGARFCLPGVSIIEPNMIVISGDPAKSYKKLIGMPGSYFKISNGSGR